MNSHVLKSQKSAWSFVLRLLAVLTLFHGQRGFGSESLYQIPLKSIDGKPMKLQSNAGKVLLIVNTASRCGYTPQYQALEKLYERYKDSGLVVLGFPSNDFGGQEPGSNQDIRYFCQSNYHVSFPLFEKGHVLGSSAQPLYRELLKESSDKAEIGWNFEKFLVGRDGSLIARYKSDVTPDDDQVVHAIEKALQSK